MPNRPTWPRDCGPRWLLDLERLVGIGAPDADTPEAHQNADCAPGPAGEAVRRGEAGDSAPASLSRL